MRKIIYSTIEEKIKSDKNNNIYFIGSDVGNNILPELRKSKPKNVIIGGIQEAHLVNFSAGLSSLNNKVYLCAISTFLTKRAYEQIYLNIGYENKDVNIIGLGGGLLYGQQGRSHLNIDDIALMRTIPNLTIYTPSSNEEMKCVMSETLNSNSPTYIRSTTDNIEELPQIKSLNINIPITYNKGKKLAVFTFGILTSKVYSIIKDSKINITLISICNFSNIVGIESTLKEIPKSHSKILVLEEHIKEGGLFELISSIVTSSHLKLVVDYRTLSKDSIYPQSNQTTILNKMNFSDEEINKLINKLLNE